MNRVYVRNVPNDMDRRGYENAIWEWGYWEKFGGLQVLRPKHEWRPGLMCSLLIAFVDEESADAFTASCMY